MTVEVSMNTSTWEKEQVVIIFSCNKQASDIIIVSEEGMDWIVNKLWELCRKHNQWTQMMENILDVLTVNRDPSELAENGSIVLDIPNNLLFSP